MNIHSDREPLVYITILQYGHYAHTSMCLESIMKIYYENYKIFVVDNNSPDNSLAKLKENYPHISIIESKTNRLFAGGYNYAIEYIKKHFEEPDYFLILNNDARIIEPNILNTLISDLRKYNASAAGPRIIEPQGIKSILEKVELWPLIMQNMLYPLYLPLKRMKNNKRNQKTRIVYTITGSCMLIRYNDFNKVNGFSDNGFLYFEEYYLADKLREKGHHILYVPSTSIYHEHSVSVDDKFSAADMQSAYIRSCIAYLGIDDVLLKRIVIQSFRIFYLVYAPLIRHFKGY